MTRKEILEKIRGARFKAFNQAEELEKSSWENPAIKGFVIRSESTTMIKFMPQLSLG